MNYLNLELTMICREPFIDADTAEIGTWLRMMTYACQQENGGVLKGAALWSNEKLLKTCGVSKRDVLRCTRLLHKDNDDLILEAYPTEAAKTLAVKRVAARNASMKRWGHASDDASDDGHEHGTTSESVRKGKEKEGKGSPPNPQGGLSGRFAALLEILKASGKVPERVSTDELAIMWRNVIGARSPSATPDDPAMLEHVKAQLSLHDGRIGTPSAWLAARVEEFVGAQKKSAGGGSSYVPPPQAWAG